MSNALYATLLHALAPLCPAGLPATAAAQPPPATPTEMHPALVSLVAVGLCVLAVWAIRRIARPAKLYLDRTPGRPNHLNCVHVVIVLAAYWLAASGAQGLLETLFLPEAGDEAARQAVKVRLQLASAAIGAAVWLGVGLLAAAMTFRHSLKRGLGMSGRRWLYDTGRAVLGYLTILPICVGLNLAAVYVFSILGISPRYHPVLEHQESFSPTWRALSIVSTVVLAPLAEEVFFRGLLQSMIRRYLRSGWLAVLIASALFAAMHLNQPQAIGSLFALAVAMGYNYERTGRLFAPILIHAIFNAVNLALWRVG